MSDLFGFADTPAPPRRAAAPAAPPRVVTPAPPAPPPAAESPAPVRTPNPAWPTLLPSAEDLADPAFCAVLDVMRPWSVQVQGSPGLTFAGTDHALLIIGALRARGLLPGPVSPQTPPADQPHLDNSLAGCLSRTLGPQAIDNARAAAAVLDALPEYELWLGMRPGAIPRSVGNSHHLAAALRRFAASATQ